MISINATLIVQIINLLVLIFILHKIMYTPIRQIMAKRQQNLVEGQAEVERLGQEAQDRLRTYEESLRKGRNDVRQSLAQLQHAVEEQAQEVIHKANEQARERSAEINTQIEAQMQQARQDIREQAQAVALTMTRTLLGREVS